MPGRDDDAARVSWSEANLPLDRAAALITLADGLCAIGRLRQGQSAGQFSIHNFLLRAALEPTDANAGGSRSSPGPLVIMMRAGVFRRHAWYMRVRRDEGGRPQRLELSSPIDAVWDWWSNIEEIRRRIVDQPAWTEAVGESYEVRRLALAGALESALLVQAGAL